MKHKWLSNMELIRWTRTRMRPDGGWTVERDGVDEICMVDHRFLFVLILSGAVNGVRFNHIDIYKTEIT